IYDRDTASRLGITPTAIDQTLYDAYGQRQVSTMFTQLNQYHVVLELLPGFQKNPLDLRELYIRTGATANSGGAGVVSGGTSSTSLSRGPVNGAANASTTIVTGPGSTASSNVFQGIAASSAVFPGGTQVPMHSFSRV